MSSNSIIEISGNGNTTVVTGNGTVLTTEISTTGPQGPPGRSFVLEKIILTQQDIDNKQIQLSSIPPSPDNVVVFPEGGIAQIAGIDFAVQNDVLTWDTLGLDGFLDLGETLIIQY